MALRDRVAALERRAAGGEMMVIVIEGGLPGPKLEIAAAGPHQWTQDLGEGLSEFELRAKSLATAAGERLLIIGGLPLTGTAMTALARKTLAPSQTTSG